MLKAAPSPICQTLAGISSLRVFTLEHYVPTSCWQNEVRQIENGSPGNTFFNFGIRTVSAFDQTVDDEGKKKWQYPNDITQPGGADASLVSVSKQVVSRKQKASSEPRFFDNRNGTLSFSDNFSPGITLKNISLSKEHIRWLIPKDFRKTLRTTLFSSEASRTPVSVDTTHLLDRFLLWEFKSPDTQNFYWATMRLSIPGDWKRPLTGGFAQVWLNGSLPGWLHLSATVIGRRNPYRNYPNTIFYIKLADGSSADGFQMPHLRKAVAVVCNFIDHQFGK